MNSKISNPQSKYVSHSVPRSLKKGLICHFFFSVVIINIHSNMRFTFLIFCFRFFFLFSTTVAPNNVINYLKDDVFHLSFDYLLHRRITVNN